MISFRVNQYRGFAVVADLISYGPNKNVILFKSSDRLAIIWLRISWNSRAFCMGESILKSLKLLRFWNSRCRLASNSWTLIDFLVFLKSFDSRSCLARALRAVVCLQIRLSATTCLDQGLEGGVLIPHSRSFFTRIPHPALFFIAIPNPVFSFPKIH